MSDFDRFKMEDQIMNCWRVVDDIHDLTEGVCEHNLTQDQISNILIGMEQLYTIRFNKLYDEFSKMMENTHYTKYGI